MYTPQERQEVCDRLNRHTDDTVKFTPVDRTYSIEAHSYESGETMEYSDNECEMMFEIVLAGKRMQTEDIGNVLSMIR